MRIDTIRKLKKLARGTITGKTVCRQCGETVEGRLPWRILLQIGEHIDEEHPHLTDPYIPGESHSK